MHTIIWPINHNIILLFWADPITSDPGWYIILHDKIPVYVGTAENLNNRLNTTKGSTDDFGRAKRKKDSERNFIKKFREINVFTKLRVVIISTSVLTCSPLSGNDRHEIEKAY